MGSRFKVFRQLDAMDCGPTCLRMVAKFYGKDVPLEYLRNKSQYGRGGVSLLGLSEAAESIGLKGVGLKLKFEELLNNIALPAILHWDQYHFVVLTPGSTGHKLRIADPARGLITLSKREFLNHWVSPEGDENTPGIILSLENSLEIGKNELMEIAKMEDRKMGWKSLIGHIKQNKKYFLKLLVGTIAAGILQLILPYLTQSIVDTGINTKNLDFIQIVLGAQLMLLFSQTVIEIIRSRILLFLSTRINISLLSDFWSKLLSLPMQFFDSKSPGDIIQRIGDHNRIENFLMGSALSTFVSISNLTIFSFVLFRYSVVVFSIFFFGSLSYLIWIQFFFKYRRTLDYKRFSLASKESSATMQLVYGIQEIKLNNAENVYRRGWERLQAQLFKIGFQSLTLNQYQQIGAFLINQSKNVTITFFVASLVVNNQLTFGMMLSIQYIIGQLNTPIDQLISFSQQAIDAKTSLERLNDIHALEAEEPEEKIFSHSLPKRKNLEIRKLSFTYPGAGNEPVLRNINLTIPEGKVTAIVGMSGSGKTTLLKLILKFYENYKGQILLDGLDFRSISPSYWRTISGAVMQDSFIFNDTIGKNIAIKDENPDEGKLKSACKAANFHGFVESLPLGFSTRIGPDGTNISGGQKQRLVIARLVYKNPEFVFFDEATNSLDANNEKVIIENMQAFFQYKTVVVVAHRLSTVKNADKIVVMENGCIAEEGVHSELIAKKGKYFELVRNQLELGI